MYIINIKIIDSIFDLNRFTTTLFLTANIWDTHTIFFIIKLPQYLSFIILLLSGVKINSGPLYHTFHVFLLFCGGCYIFHILWLLGVLSLPINTKCINLEFFLNIYQSWLTHLSLKDWALVQAQFIILKSWTGKIIVHCLIAQGAFSLQRLRLTHASLRGAEELRLVIKITFARREKSLIFRVGVFQYCILCWSQLVLNIGE